MFDQTVAEFRVENLRQLIGNGLIFGVHQLGGEDAGKEPRETIKLDGELTELPLGHVTGSKTCQIGIVDRSMPKHVRAHLFVKRHRAPPSSYKDVPSGSDRMA